MLTRQTGSDISCIVPPLAAASQDFCYSPSCPELQLKADPMMLGKRSSAPPYLCFSNSSSSGGFITTWCTNRTSQGFAGPGSDTIPIHPRVWPQMRGCGGRDHTETHRQYTIFLSPPLHACLITWLAPKAPEPLHHSLAIYFWPRDPSPLWTTT
jgi:hypothetical protein